MEPLVTEPDIGQYGYSHKLRVSRVSIGALQVLGDTIRSQSWKKQGHWTEELVTGVETK